MDSINSLTINLNQNNESPLPHTTTTMPIATTVITHGCNFQRPELGTATRLIELVKLYPELYDKTHPFYCNNVHKGVLWHRIADELGGTSGK
uniref:MADF domain-containing protein n=1 Tax=Panagrolaimus davidi TaxID=227884 RepID=A0A914QQ00_9BILA